NAWRRTATFAAPDPGARGFGSSVALRGKRLLVGAPGKDEEFDFDNNAVLWSGAVYAYRLRNHRWVQVQRLATNVPAQPSYASVQFGWEIVTNGRHVWITAPFAHDQSDSSIQAGRPALYRWNAGQLEYVIDGPDSYAEGAIDMSRRYVIESDLFNFGLQSTEGAHNVDLRTLVPTDTDADEETADVDRQE
ncbi:MAG TPA: FG-GAP repeat protein, partial [Steroidobacteraceae bacterium]|nr:FG-GAP repeat protein [Steroidobacteraceae bacterium]